MADTELPWLVLGRRIRPYALAVSMASAVVAYALLLRGNDAGSILDHTWEGNLVGATAAAATGLLWFGWWARSDRAMSYGLLLTAGVFAARFVFLMLDGSQIFITGLLSLCWVVASGGAYLLEATARRGRRE